MNTKRYWGFLLACLAFGSAFADINTQLRELAPAGVVLSEINEQDGFVRLSGEAAGQDKVSELMRAIDRSDLGSPGLIKMQRTGDRSTFVLRIRR